MSTDVCVCVICVCVCMLVCVCVCITMFIFLWVQESDVVSHLQYSTTFSVSIGRSFFLLVVQYIVVHKHCPSSVYYYYYIAAHIRLLMEFSSRKSSQVFLHTADRTVVMFTVHTHWTVFIILVVLSHVVHKQYR